MTLSRRERALIGVLVLVLVGSLGFRWWTSRSADGGGISGMPGPGASPSPTVVLTSAPSPTFAVPVDARDPFQP